MDVKREMVEKVIALFDDEDIQYIHSDKVDVGVIEEIVSTEKAKVKVKTLGGEYDRQGE